MIRKSCLIVRGTLVALVLLLTLPVQASFTDNGDGTVTDTVTGLMWDQCSWGQTSAACGSGAASTHNWQQALGVAITANAMNGAAGYKNRHDWRLPNQNELESLVDLSVYSPAINTTPFPNTVSGSYWSSTTYVLDPTWSWYVDFLSGSLGPLPRTSTYHVRLVRGGPSFGAFDAQAPTSPFNVVAVLVGARARVDFSAPIGNGAVIHGYTVHAFAVGTAGSMQPQLAVGSDIDAGSLSQSHTVTGLDSGRAYMFTVTAHGSEGDSLASAPISPTAGSTGTLSTRYRLYSDDTHEHLYTTDANEYNVLAARGNWLAEGAIYQLFQGEGSLSGVAAVPYYRLYNPLSYQHHWTTDLNEYTVLATQGWSQEGVDGYILPTHVTGSLPLYRLYLNAFGGLHLWTTDANEKAVLSTSQGWVNEGVAGHVIPLP